MEYLFCRYTLLGYINFILNDKILMVFYYFFIIIYPQLGIVNCYHFVRQLQLLHTNADHFHNISIIIRVLGFLNNKMRLIISNVIMRIRYKIIF